MKKGNVHISYAFELQKAYNKGKAEERARWEKKIEDKITSNLDLRSGRGEWDGALMLIKKELLGEKQ